jgi:hypothetical protein
LPFCGKNKVVVKWKSCSCLVSSIFRDIENSKNQNALEITMGIGKGIVYFVTLILIYESFGGFHLRTKYLR